MGAHVIEQGLWCEKSHVGAQSLRSLLFVYTSVLCLYLSLVFVYTCYAME